MAQNSNEILSSILGVCIKIHNKMEGGDKGSATGTIADVLGTRRGRSRSADAKSGVGEIKDTLGVIDKLSKSKFDSKKINATTAALKGLFDVIINIGRKKAAVKNAIELFDSLGKSLQGMTSFIKSFSQFILSIGASILMIAGSVWLAGKMLGSKGDPMGTGGVMGIITGVVLGMVGMMFLLAKASEYIDPGIKTAQGMGKALLLLGAGILSFVIAFRLVPMILGVGKEGGMSLGAIGTSILAIVTIIGAMAGVFWLMGKMHTEVAKGAAVAGEIALGMGLLSLGVLSIALTSRLLTGFGNQKNKDGNQKFDQKTGFGRMMAAMGPGLGAFGIILAGGVGALVGLGFLMGTGLLELGLLGAISVAVGMGALALGVLSVMTVAKKIGKDDVKGNISNMVGGVLGGLVEGISNGMMGDSKTRGERGLLGNLATFVKNGAMLTASIGILMGVSVALSMFAYALTAFANLKNMRVIESYDPKTGKPKFGPTVNIEGVGKTVSLTIGDFLKNLIADTSKLTKKQGPALRKLGRALTGRRGILAAIIQFADVIKTFSQFGPAGEIGYVEMVPDGKDEDGNDKFKQVQSKVKINVVVKNITESFGQFAKEMSNKAGDFGVTGKAGRQMLNFSEALLGSDARKIFGLQFGKKKPGMLTAIKTFAETLQIYAKFGAKNEVPIFDEVTGELKSSVPVQTVANNVMKMLTSFTTALANQQVGEDVKSAEKNINRFENIIDSITKIGAAMDPLTRLTANIGLLADNMARLAVAMGTLDNAKMAELNTIANKSLVVSSSGKSFGSGAAAGNTTASQTNVYQTTNVAGTAAQKVQEVDWDAVSIAIGNQVAAAMKNGTFHFEFSTDKTGVMMFGK
jgi:hypothetical protein